MVTANFNVTFNYKDEYLEFLDTSNLDSIDSQYFIGNFNILQPDGTVLNNPNNTFITGTAQAGGATSITLAVGASAVDDLYKDLYVYISGGMGVGEFKKITAYNGTTKVATVESAWVANPDNTSTYKITLGDIYLGVDLNNQKPIVVPLTSDDKPLNGTYTITYTLTDTNSAVDYTLVKTFTLCYESPVVSIGQEVDCISPLFTSTDNTNYIVDSVTPTITRTHTLIFPANIPNQSGNVQTIPVGVFYTGVQTSKLVTELSYDFGDGVYVTDEVEGVATVDVACDNRLCDIFCCIITLYNKMKRYQGKDNTLYTEYRDDFTQVMSLVALAREAWSCGKEDKLNQITEDIRTIAGCEEGCGCSDDTPQQVTGLGANLSIVEVQTGGSPVQVTPTTVGATTIYTIKLDPAFVTKVNGLYSTTISTATPSYLGITSSGTNPKNYNIDFTPSPAWINQDELSFKFLVDYFDYLGTFVTVENTEVVPASGSNFESPTVAPKVPAANTTTFLNTQSIFVVSSFMVTPNDNYKAFVTLELVEYDGVTNADYDFLNKWPKTFLPQINYVGNGTFEIGIMNNYGTYLNEPLRNSAVKFYIHVLIKK